MGHEQLAVTASTEIDREDFGMTWNVALETGGVLVSKKVGIEIEARRSARPDRTDSAANAPEYTRAPGRIALSRGTGRASLGSLDRRPRDAPARADPEEPPPPWRSPSARSPRRAPGVHGCPPVRVSFLQCPSWAAVKREWGHESIGWYDDAVRWSAPGSCCCARCRR